MFQCSGAKVMNIFVINSNMSLLQKGVVPPPSLKNMFKELKEDITGFEVPTHGDLTGWAKQGVINFS